MAYGRHTATVRWGRARALFLAAGILAATACGARPRAPSRWASQPCGAIEHPWFGDLGPPLRIDVDEARAVLHAAFRVLRGEANEAEGLPVGLRGDREARIVVVSASDGYSRARLGIGAARGFAPALAQALAEIPPVSQGSPVVWMRLDVVDRATAIDLASPDTTALLRRLERSQDGLAWGSETGFLQLPGRPTNDCGADCDRRGMMARAAECASEQVAHPKETGARVASRSAPVWRFTTTSFFYDGGDVLELRRGHRVRPALTADLLLRAARAAGEYLRRVTGKDGAFLYAYGARRDRPGDDYNMVRHAGAVYAMLELWEMTHDRELLAAAERALAYLLRHVERYGADGERASVLAYRGKIKLGGVGLTVLELVEYISATGRRDHLETAQQLCRYIALSQGEDGAFVHSRDYPSGAVRDFQSRYYPGEAVFALTRMYDVDGNEAWLDVAERGARFLIEVRDRDRSTDELDHDHWLLYGLNELYRHRPRAELLHHAMRIASSIARAQHRSPEPLDHLGTYYDPPRSAPVATRSEGLLAAYALARDFGEPEMAWTIRRTLELNIGFQLLTQVGPERALFLPAPHRAIGGFTRGLTRFDIRIDTVQHNLSALLGFYRLLRAEEAATVSGETRPER